MAKYSEYVPFDKFIKVVKSVFAFLKDRYVFELESIAEAGCECSIRYKNRTTGVEIEYDVPELPNVSICQLKKGGSEWGKQYGLVYLIMERCPSHALQGFSAETLKTDQFRPILSHYAGILEEYGADLLSGDFSVFPNLEKHARRQIRELKRGQRPIKKHK